MMLLGERISAEKAAEWGLIYRCVDDALLLDEARTLAVRLAAGPTLLPGLFGAQRVYRGEPGSYHSGVDVARPTGTPLMAPADGVVVLATPGEFTLEGRLLMIDHGMGLNSAFLHMDRIDVREGDTVRRGQRLGTVGATGRATGPHMHWGMKWADARIDPLLLAGPMPAAE